MPSAMPSAARRRSSSATTRDARPQASASAAPIGALVRNMSIARARPGRRGQQGGHAAVGGQPDRRVRRPQPGARAEHDEVTGERQRQPDARRPAVDGDDHGRREVEQGPLTGVDGVGQLGEAAVGLRGEPGDVAADAEVRALGDDLDAAGVPGGAGQGARGTAGRTRGRRRCDARGSPAPAGTRRRTARPGSVRGHSRALPSLRTGPAMLPRSTPPAPAEMIEGRQTCPTCTSPPPRAVTSPRSSPCPRSATARSPASSSSRTRSACGGRCASTPSASPPRATSRWRPPSTPPAVGDPAASPRP